jgi:cytochrome d ubiquinol oxidase subunit II
VAGGLCGGYVLLGATWLVLKSEGELQRKSIAWAKWGLLWVALAVALVSIATPLESATVRQKWFSFPLVVFLSPLPVLTFFAGVFLYRNLGKSDWKPFAYAVAIYVLAFAGLAYSLFPYVIIDRMTIWEAAAHPSALKFVGAGIAIVLPFIAGYTIYVYRVFGGKAKSGALY